FSPDGRIAFIYRIGEPHYAGLWDPTGKATVPGEDAYYGVRLGKDGCYYAGQSHGQRFFVKNLSTEEMLESFPVDARKIEHSQLPTSANGRLAFEKAVCAWKPARSWWAKIEDWLGFEGFEDETKPGRVDGIKVFDISREKREIASFPFAECGC